MKAPGWLDPMLATLVDDAPDGTGWVYERKHDGIRALAFHDGRGTRLLSRNKLTLSFEPVERALEGQPRAFVCDGEVVAYAGGRTSFELLQQRGSRRVSIRYHVFDLLWLDGEDLRALPLTERKARLRDAIAFGGALRPSPHRRGDGEALRLRACAHGWEGVIAKRADAPYRAGRSRDWLKLKCVLEQEFAIAGYTDPKGSRVGIGAVLLGYHEDGGLRYAGEVGTGFSTAMLRELEALLKPAETDRSPFVDLARRKKDVHWVKPRLVCQVAFSEWTRDGRLRHPRFLGLRTDKRPRDVVRERPA